MPTPYKGKIRISCGLEVCNADRSRQDVRADCMGCPDAIREIVDLFDNVLFAYPGISRDVDTRLQETPEGRKRSKKQGGK